MTGLDASGIVNIYQDEQKLSDMDCFQKRRWKKLNVSSHISVNTHIYPTRLHTRR